LSNTTSETSPVPVSLVLIVGILAVSFSAIFIKWSAAPAAVLGMYRLLITVVLFLPIVFVRRRELLQLTRYDWLWLSISGVFLGLHFLFWISSLKWTSVASSMILTSLEPVFVLIGAFFLFRERSRKVGLIGVVIAILGTCIVGWGDLGTSRAAVTGDTLSLLGTVAVSVYMLAGQHVRNRMSSPVYNTIVFLVAGIVLLVYNLSTRTPLVGYAAREWGIFLLLALFPTVLGHGLFNWVLKYVRASTISMAVLGEPLGAIVLAYILLGESVSVAQIAGGVLTLLGVAVYLRTPRPASMPTPALEM